MGKFTKGENSQTVALNFNTNAPLDDRTVVTTKASLIGEDTWIKADYLFKGLITAVLETNELYMYIGNIGNLFPDDFFVDTTTTTPSVSDETIAKYWKKISSSGLEDLSGVFTFKGVAEEINNDKNILTTCKVITATVTDEEGKVTQDSEILHCVTTAHEFDQDLYYGWGTSLEDIRFWTDTAIVTNATALYEKGTKEINIKAYEFNGELYYPIDPIVESPAADPATPYESVDGDIIYITSEGKVYNNSQALGNTIGTATSTEHTGYDFSVKLSIALEAETSSEGIPASSDNSGHVYQIGENEYASNGQIWVKLGSPVEDWIIL